RMVYRGNRRHLLDTVDQPGDLFTKLFTDNLEPDPLLPNGAVKNSRHKTGLIQTQFSQHLSHFKTGPETAGARRPDSVLPERLQVNFSGLFTRLPKLLHIIQMGLGSDMLHPSLDINLAIAGHCVVFANFYHICLAIPVDSHSD